MSELTYRVRRFLFGSPFDPPAPAERAALHEYLALWDEEHPRVYGPEHTAPSGRKYRTVVPPDGLSEEVAFRRYARRSGEFVRDETGCSAVV